MSTFGREHEERCAADCFRRPADPAARLALIDAVHDRAEGHATVVEVRPRFVDCRVHGAWRA